MFLLLWNNEQPISLCICYPFFLSAWGRTNGRRTIEALTIPVVVGVEGDEDDLDDGEEHEAVDDEGEHAEHVVRVPDAVVEGGRVDVQGRRPDVAVQDAHALERQPQRPPPAILQGVMGNRKQRVKLLLPFYSAGCGW